MDYDNREYDNRSYDNRDNRSNNSKIIAVMIGCFLVGGIVGFLAGINYGKKEYEKEVQANLDIMLQDPETVSKMYEMIFRKPVDSPW